jgi:hypothetical protein
LENVGKLETLICIPGNNSTMKKFKGLLENPEKEMDIAYIAIPFDVENVYGTKGQV